jgi:peptidoglycan lytic transglycosylase
MPRSLQLCLILSFSLILGCASAPRLKPEARALMTPGSPLVSPPDLAVGPAQVGRASFYHSFFDGRLTASGTKFSNAAMTAAHRTLDFGTRVRVTNLVNLKSVVVTITDRGPYVAGRIIDLSRRAATALGFVHAGVTKVKVEPLL